MGGIGIIHAFWLPQYPGAIYVMAQSPQHIQRAFERVHTVYTLDGNIAWVPPADRDLVYQSNRPVPVKVGDWVRVRKKCVYKDDIAYVLNADLLNSTVTVLLFPRLSYLKDCKSPITRPLPAHFDHNRARFVFGPTSVCGDDATQAYTFREMSFQSGLLKCVFPFRQLVMKDIRPTFKEMENFCPYLIKTTPSWDWSQYRWYRDDYLNSLRIGDRVRVVRGEGMGQVGYLVDVKEYGVVEVRLSAEINANLNQDLQLELPTHYTVRAFQVGDYVRVRHGIHTGVRGHVVEIDKKILKVIALPSDNLEVCPAAAEFQLLLVLLTRFVTAPGPDHILRSAPY